MCHFDNIKARLANGRTLFEFPRAPTITPTASGSVQTMLNLKGRRMFYSGRLTRKAICTRLFPEKIPPGRTFARLKAAIPRHFAASGAAVMDELRELRLTRILARLNRIQPRVDAIERALEGIEMLPPSGRTVCRMAESQRRRTAIDRNISKRQFYRLMALSQTSTEERANASARSSSSSEDKASCLTSQQTLVSLPKNRAHDAELSRGVDHR